MKMAKMKKKACVLALGLLLLSLAGCGAQEAPAAEETVVFSDGVLEQMVRTAIDRPDGGITVSEAQAVTALDLRMDGNDWSQPRIHDLDALRYFSNLQSLDLSWAVQDPENSFAPVDIDALGSLTNLESLQLACVNVSDIQTLASLSNLKHLSLWGGKQLQDIGPLEALTSLEILELKDNIIRDLTPLASLSQLFYLDVSGNLIEDVTPLAGLENLNEFYVGDNPVADYTPLAGLANQLEQRDFEPVAQPQPIDFRDPVLEQRIREALGIPTGDITLNDTRAVTELSLGNPAQEDYPAEKKIRDISALKYFPKLFKLELYFHDIEWIHVARALPELGILDLNGNKVADLLPLVYCPAMKSLNLSGNQCNTEGLEPLLALTQLEWLDVSHCPNVGNVDALKGMASLDTLVWN